MHQASCIFRSDGEHTVKFHLLGPWHVCVCVCWCGKVTQTGRQQAVYYPKPLFTVSCCMLVWKITITSNVSEIMWDVDVRVTRSWCGRPRKCHMFHATTPRQVLVCCQSRCCSGHVSAHSLVSYNFWGTHRYIPGGGVDGWLRAAKGPDGSARKVVWQEVRLRLYLWWRKMLVLPKLKKTVSCVPHKIQNLVQIGWAQRMV